MKGQDSVNQYVVDVEILFHPRNLISVIGDINGCLIRVKIINDITNYYIFTPSIFLCEQAIFRWLFLSDSLIPDTYIFTQ